MKKIIFILAVLVLLQGCKEDFLDTKPRDSYTDETLWTSKADAMLALNAVYKGWELGGNILFLDCISDNGWSDRPWDGYDTYAQGLATSTNPGVQEYTYTTINRCNWFLDNIDKVPDKSFDDATKNRVKGEARFIRSYRYFLLYQLYGNVPLIEHTLSLAESNNVLQTPKDKIVEFILKELTEIAPLLPVKYPTSDLGRITRGAAIALKARVELLESKFPDCIASAQQLMAAPFDYNIYPDFENLFRPAYVNAPDNKEVILDVQYLINNNSNSALQSLAPNSVGGRSAMTPIQSLVDEFETINGKPIAEDKTYDPMQPYTNRDPRLDQGIIRPGLLWMGTYFDPYSGVNKKKANNASQTGYHFKKYLANADDYKNTPYGINLFNTGGSIIVIRFAEVLLTFAEAKIEANQIDASVYDAINRVRQRSSVKMPIVTAEMYPDQASLRKLVRRERRVELFGEGLRWYDIKRWKIATTVMNGPIFGTPDGTVDKTGKLTLIPNSNSKFVTRQFEEKNYLIPFPFNDLTINKNLVQNPGY